LFPKSAAAKNEGRIGMKKTLMILTVSVLLLFALSVAVYNLGGKSDFWETMSITFGVTAYHFVMRLHFGYLVAKHQYRVNSRWFSEKAFEGPLYKAIRVKEWKKYLPTYSPELFDIKGRELGEIIESTCRSELGHEAIMAFSFLPLFLIHRFGAAGVFIGSSVAAALADSLFVIVQRYNRPRLQNLERNWNKRMMT
jgi:hypothetical protein